MLLQVNSAAALHLHAIVGVTSRQTMRLLMNHIVEQQQASPPAAWVVPVILVG